MKFVGCIRVSFFIILFGCAKKETMVCPGPISVIQSKKLGVEMYDFKSLEPLLKRQNDTVYIVNFWATWCRPCVKELPYFEMLGRLYKAQKVKVLLVSLDMESQIESKLIPFIKKQRIESQVVVLDNVDSNNWITKVDDKWTGSIPATMIYKNRRRLFFEKSLAYKELEDLVKKVM